MPLRAIGYVLSAVSCAESLTHIAQIQVVNPVHTAERVNGIGRHEALEEFEKLRMVTHPYIDTLFPDLADNVVFATDTEALPTSQTPIENLLQRDPKLADKLESMANRRSASAAEYVSAHLALHDTKMPIDPLPGEIEPIDPSVIVSVGAQSERIFYAARMLCRDEAGLSDPVDATGQLFTRHVIPPYNACREGEPNILETDMLIEDITHCVPSVYRDLQYTARFIGGSIHA